MGYDETLRDFRAFLKEDEKETLDKVQSIAIDHVDVEVKRPWESYNKMALLRGFPNLKEVLLILRDGDGRSGLEGFKEPKLNPEELLRMWVDFRQSFAMEEKVLEDVSRVLGEEYVKWSLPVVRIRSKT